MITTTIIIYQKMQLKNPKMNMSCIPKIKDQKREAITLQLVK